MSPETCLLIGCALPLLFIVGAATYFSRFFGTNHEDLEEFEDEWEYDT